MSTQKRDDSDRLFEELGLSTGPARPRTYFRSGTRELTPLELFERDQPTDPEKAKKIKLSHGTILQCVLETARVAYSDPNCRVKSIRGTTYADVPPEIPSSSYENYYYDKIAFLIEVPSVHYKIGKHEISLSIGCLHAYPDHPNALSFVRNTGLFQLLVGFNVYVCTNLHYSTEGIQFEVKAETVKELEQEVHRLIGAFDLEKSRKELENWKSTSAPFSNVEALLMRMRRRSSRRLPQDFLNRNPERSVQLDALNVLRQRHPLTPEQIAQMREAAVNDPNFSRESRDRISLWHLYNLITEVLKDAPFGKFLKDHEWAYRFVQGLYIEAEWSRMAGQYGGQASGIFASEPSNRALAATSTAEKILDS